ncbi:MAG: CRISPR system precrRNA processing endoribonuclease RAMP protein Cas6 [Anaerolineae bacterium]|nr:CRISPR system precrRNA processing endoribonuclease RAMP protein Cas6 [Anaerolineae bacterium]
MNLTVHHLLFTLQAQTLVHLGPQAGAQIRGGLWAALREFACAAPTVQGDPDHARHCPMCRLVALETAESARGVTPPRPFAVRPPLPASPGQDSVYYSGETFVVGINLFGEAVDSFPYLCQAFHRLGQLGLGYGRGRFTLQRIQAVNPLSGATHDLMDGRRIVALPDLPVEGDLVQRVASGLPADHLRLRFLTPTELTCQGRHADRPYFDVLIARLLERCQALEEHYATEPAPRTVWQQRYQHLTQAAQGVRLAEYRTRWVRVKSSSRRTQSVNAVSGFVGEAVVEGDLQPFCEWLMWGASLHVGKNAVKGNGWYALDALL